MYDVCAAKFQEIFPDINEEIIQKVLVNVKRVYYGYLDDKRNTG